MIPWDMGIFHMIIFGKYYLHKGFQINKRVILLIMVFLYKRFLVFLGTFSDSRYSIFFRRLSVYFRYVKTTMLRFAHQDDRTSVFYFRPIRVQKPRKPIDVNPEYPQKTRKFPPSLFQSCPYVIEHIEIANISMIEHLGSYQVPF